MEERKLIALTFDDGPNNTVSRDVLEILRENDVTATFFLIGSKLTAETEETVRMEVAQGCEICCHSTAHAMMDRMIREEIENDYNACMDKITRVTGYRPAFFRPPFIAVNDLLMDAVELPFICGIHGEDWMPEVTAEQRKEKILAQIADGSIILMHDMTGNINTVEALKTLIPELKAMGYGFVTLSELFRMKGVTPVRGRVYSNVFQQTVR